MTQPQTAAVVALAALLVGGALGAGATTLLAPPSAGRPGVPDQPSAPGDGNGTATGVAAFEDAADYAAYVRRGRTAATSRVTTRLLGAAPRETVEVEREAPQATAAPEATRSGDAETVSYAAGGADVRHSTTNVQVQGIDEPDLVKTDGETAFYSPRRTRHPEPGRAGASGATHVLSVGSPAAPEQLGSVEAGGRMLLVGDTLVVLGAQSLTGYDVTDPERPEEVWSKPVEGTVEAARLVDGRLYLVTRLRADPAEPCPLTPLGDGSAVACSDVYHPRTLVDADATYTALAVAPDSGAVLDSVGFVGTAGRSVVYAGTDALYVTYTRHADRSKALLDVVVASLGDRMDARTRQRLRELRTYELSARAREVELRVVVREWLGGLSEDERATARERLRNAWTEYAETHKREFVTTGVVEVSYGDANRSGGTANLSVTATGSVPGVPLNQFSLSARDGRLRVATTVDAPAVDSENDLYVLDGDLEVAGSVTGMGLTERIYSVRYVGDTAYVVTFRRVDPFHVVDLSDPTDPTVEGELKLPGYSSYLHPLDGDRVLGVGEEDGAVKAVVFDVSDPSSPTVADDYRLSERWSAIADSHHAFLLDRRHGVFFLPGSEGGYVFGYEDGLSLETVVSTDAPATRAIYVGDHLYVFAGTEVVVVDEETWERTATLQLE